MEFTKPEREGGGGMPVLLLRRSQVCARLEWPPETVQDYRRDGDLRVFLPNPESGHGYYFAADVARIAGDNEWPKVVGDWLGALPPWLGLGELSQCLGLCEDAIYRACAHGQLVAVREERDGKDGKGFSHRRFYSRDLEWFL